MDESQLHYAKFKEARFKRLRGVCFQLYDILEYTKLQGQKIDEWLPGLGVGRC